MKKEMEITIKKYSKNSYILISKHRDFSLESYIAKSVKGLLSAVENLLNGCQPNQFDLLLEDDGYNNIHSKNNSSAISFEDVFAGLLQSAKDLKHHIDIQPPGKMIDPASKKEVIKMPSYEVACKSLEEAENFYSQLKQ